MTKLIVSGVKKYNQFCTLFFSIIVPNYYTSTKHFIYIHKNANHQTNKCTKIN